ncbi:MULTISPECIES: hypothetical protein [Streptomyces]|uniref:Vegetative cell wall protein gp1 n=1 Tax=Streptomyces dengpaensis TaxID=2049881 RepID=A0ABM6SJK6_9ACTN|nr:MULTISPECIES: hypothetical protein [Streptomyces]AVH54857.1 hypothetical protein C4B68_02525 [Streptomyces dengpaensis]PIB03289.1 hypothetical protein B1C81_37550 [Streptomyces sp. HG99]
MNAILAELGKRVAERWLSLLVLPGALYLAVAAAGAVVLRHSGWYDLVMLADYLNRVAARRRGIGQVVLISGAMLLGSAGVGLVAQAVSGGVARLWLAAGRGPLGRRLTGWRRKRWQAAHEAYQNALLERYRRQQGWGEGGNRSPLPDSARLLVVRNRICLVEPDRPTWMADRMRAAGERVHRAYDLDLTAAWPRLWLCMPDMARAEIATAQSAFASASRLAGWGLLYLVLAVWWWPSAVIACVTVGAAWQRGRAATAALAELVESAVDLYGRDLAQALGLSCPDEFTPDHGASLTRMLRKGV